MKVRASVKKLCRNCKIIRREGCCSSNLQRGTASQTAPRLSVIRLKPGS